MAFTGVGMIALDQLTSITLESNKISILNIGIGIVAAVLSGVAYTAVIKLKKTDVPITIVMYFPMVSIPLMTILCLWKFTMPRRNRMADFIHHWIIHPVCSNTINESTA